MKILIIDNNMDEDCWGAEDLRKYTALASDSTVITRRAPQGDLPLNSSTFDRVIVSGSRTSALEDSHWVNRLIEFTRTTVTQKKPFLGICFGHQILARTLGGSENLAQAVRPEFGWSKIKVEEKSLLLEGLGDSFYSFSAHYEEVTHLPKGMRKLASSEISPIQACQVAELPVFGIQFHPEKNIQAAEKTFKEKRSKNKSQPSLTLLHPGRSKDLYDPQVAQKIFHNFFKI
jgi:GMP synthase-like glutamine amidotransferase